MKEHKEKKDEEIAGLQLSGNTIDIATDIPVYYDDTRNMETYNK